MKNKVVWMVVSCLMVLSLVLASCAPAPTPTSPTPTSPTPTSPTPTSPTPTSPTPTSPTPKPTAAPEEPEYGGFYSIATAAALVSGFDEGFVAWAASPHAYLTCETLIDADWAKGLAGSKEIGWQASVFILKFMTGCLAESWEIVGDGTIILHIRKGIHFQDKPPVNGRELVADDVVFSIRRVYTMPSAQAFTVRPEGQTPEVSARDKYTVVLKCPPHLVAAFLEDCCHKVRIIPHEVIEKYGDMRDWRSVIGTGPFMVKDYVPQSIILFERNPNYWRKDPVHPENQLPYLDGVKWFIMDDISSRLAGLRTGKLEGLCLVSRDDALNLLETNPDLKWETYTVVSSKLLYMRIDKPELPFKDIRVRRALFMAIDFESMSRDFYGKAAFPSQPVGPWPEYSDIYIPLDKLPESVREIYSYHPDKAKQLLADAGYPNGFKTEVVCSTEWVDELSIVKAYWARIGVDLQLDIREEAVLRAFHVSRAYKEMIVRSMGNGVPYRMMPYRTDCLQNLSIIEDEYNDKVYADITAKALDEGYVAKVYREWIPYALDKAWFIDLPAPYTYSLWWPWVGGYHGEYAPGTSRYYGFIPYVWINQEQKRK